MEDTDDFKTDPAVAEMMGFASFGMQPKKKRKVNADNAFIDPQALSDPRQPVQSQGSGATSLPLATSMADRTTGRGKTVAPGGYAPEAQHLRNREESASSAKPSARADPLQSATGESQHNIQSLRHGVKNDRGDMVYFLPSFLEDPWKSLKRQ